MNKEKKLTIGNKKFKGLFTQGKFSSCRISRNLAQPAQAALVEVTSFLSQW
jgi:hypothetical protein